MLRMSVAVAVLAISACASEAEDVATVASAGHGSEPGVAEATSGSGGDPDASGPAPGTTTHTSDDPASTSGDDGGHDPPRKTSGDGATGDDETDGPVYTQACVDGCAVEASCGDEWSSEIECILWCEDNLVEAGRFSPFCQMAWENLHACIGTLDCPGYADYLMGGESCLIASYTHAVECEGQF